MKTGDIITVHSEVCIVLGVVETDDIWNLCLDCHGRVSERWV